MARLIVSNAFSLSMLPEWCRRGDDWLRSKPAETSLRITHVPRPADFVARMLRYESIRLESAVGHADTAALFTAVLGVPIEARRVSVELGWHDIAFVGQYVGPRLPEGATQLPEGAVIHWYAVRYAPHPDDRITIGGRMFADEVSAAAAGA